MLAIATAMVTMLQAGDQVVSVADAAGAAPSATREVILTWPEDSCPSEGDMTESLQALGLRVREAGEGPEVAESAAVEAVRINGSLELLVVQGDRKLQRIVHLTGTCEERAAVIAAIVDRALRPLYTFGRPTAREPAPPATITQEFEIELAPQGKGTPLPVVSSADDPADHQLTLAEGRPPLWILSGALVVLGGEGPTFRGGADAEVRYEFAEEMFAVARLSYRTPLIERVGPAEVRVDDGVAALGMQIGNPLDPLALQATATLQVAWAHGYGLDDEYSFVNANPGFTIGACYQSDLGFAGLEACARGFGFLVRQEIHVNGEAVLGAPRVGGELTLGFTYQIL